MLHAGGRSWKGNYTMANPLNKYLIYFNVSRFLIFAVTFDLIVSHLDAIFIYLVEDKGTPVAGLLSVW